MSFNKKRIVNIMLHGGNLAARFLFIFFLAKLLQPNEIGYYGLFAATVSYSMYFVGLDFYTYVSREIVKTPLSQRGKILKSQLTLSGVLYLIYIPSIYAILMPFSQWPTTLLFCFLPILFLEHINQEGYRLLVVLGEQVTASLALFSRQGLLAFLVIVLMMVIPAMRHLEIVMFLWIISGSLAGLFTVWKIRSLQFGGWKLPTDWRWIKRGVIVSVTFLIGTLALRGMLTFDRYWLQALGGVEIVAAYVLFFGVASAMMTFLDSGVFAFAYPTLIQHYHNKDFKGARIIMVRMLIMTTAISGCYAILSLLLLPFFLMLINNSYYTENVYLYPWLMSATIINAFGMIPHFGLYAIGNDKPIIKANMAALITFLFSALSLADYFHELAIPIALNFAFLTLLIFNTLSYLRSIRSQSNSIPQFASEVLTEGR